MLNSVLTLTEALGIINSLFVTSTILLFESITLTLTKLYLLSVEIFNLTLLPGLAFTLSATTFPPTLSITSTLNSLSSQALSSKVIALLTSVVDASSLFKTVFASTIALLKLSLF